MMFVAKSPNIARYIKSATNDARLVFLLRSLDELDDNDIDDDVREIMNAAELNDLDNGDDSLGLIEDGLAVDEDEDEEPEEWSEEEVINVEPEPEPAPESEKEIINVEPEAEPELTQDTNSENTEPEPCIEPEPEPNTILDIVNKNQNSIVCYSTERNIVTILPVSKNLASNWAILVRMQETGMDRLFVSGNEVFIAGYGDYMVANEYNINTYIARLTIIADRSFEPAPIIKRIAKLRGML